MLEMERDETVVYDTEARFYWEKLVVDLRGGKEYDPSNNVVKIKKYMAFEADQYYTMDEIYERGEIYRQKSKVLACQLADDPLYNYAALGIYSDYSTALLKSKVRVCFEGIERIYGVDESIVHQGDWLITAYPWIQGEVPFLRVVSKEDFGAQYESLGFSQECRFDFLEFPPETVTMEAYRCVRKIRAIQNPFYYPIHARQAVGYRDGDENCWLCEPIYGERGSFDQRCLQYRRPEQARFGRFILTDREFGRAYARR